jgi:hypothetical protein
LANLRYTSDVDPLDAIPPSLRRRVEAELQPGETPLWAGMPDPLRSALPLLFLFVFGIGWSSIAFSFEGVALAGLFAGRPGPDGSGNLHGWTALMMALFGLPFVAIGVGLLASPFVAAIRAMLTAHVVTNKRLLTVVGGPWPSVESRTGGSLTFVRRRDARAGHGTLRLGFGTERDSDGDPRSVEVPWIGIPGVRDAEGAVRQLAEASGRRL